VDRSHLDGDQALDTRDAVAGKGKRKRRKRTTQAATLRRIDAKARDRQDIRSERQPIGNRYRRPPILSEDELRARDVTRELRVERITDGLECEFENLRALRAGA